MVENKEQFVELKALFWQSVGNQAVEFHPI